MRPRSSFRSRLAVWLIGLVAAGAALLMGARWLAARAERARGQAPPGPDAHPLRGLSDAEAALRQPGIDLDQLAARARRDFIVRSARSNLFTVFNLDMFAITGLMFLLGSPSSGLVTAAVLTVNVVVRVAQELRSRRRLEAMIGSIRPRVTVIREGAPRQLPVREVVKGDLMAIGLGDEVPVAAMVVGGRQIHVSGMSALGRDGGTPKRSGDRVEAGSYCVDGRAILRADEAGAEREALRIARAEPESQSLTPLEALVRRILFTLLALVAVFSVALLTHQYILTGAPDSEAAYRNAFSLVFSVAPTSLFFVLVISYVTGIVDVARRGALVYRAGSIETMAEVGTVCLTTRSVMGGAQVALIPVDPLPAGAPPPDLARRLLGDLMQTLTPYTTANEVIGAALAGSTRQPVEMAGHLSFYGWQGASFDEPDIRGTLVVGLADVVEPALEAPGAAAAPEGSPRVVQARAAGRGPVARVGRIVKRMNPLANRSRRAPRSTDSGRPGIRSRIAASVQRALAPRDSERDAGRSASPAPPGGLVFAYRPDPAALSDSEGEPALPSGLVQLAEIRVSQSLSAAATRSVGALQAAGLSVVLLTDTDAPAAAGLAASLAVDRVVNVEASRTPAGTDAIGSLKSTGGLVAEVGHGLADLASAAAADLRFAMRGASQAVLAAADVVLLEDSLAALPGILSAGRRIVNGVVAILELNLSHILSQALLLTAALVFVFGQFPYTPIQSGTITAFGITIPSVLLTLLASSRRPGPGSPLGRLARFVLPNGVATTALVLGVFLGYQAVGRSVADAQLTTTWVLVAAGLLRVLMAVPPSRLWVGAEGLVGDPRVVALTGISGILFLAATAIPLTRGLIGSGWLSSPTDYLVLAGALIIWTVCQLGFWRLVWRRPGTLASETDV
jgi:cation-transporting ATPase E